MDSLLSDAAAQPLIDVYGRETVKEELRRAIRAGQTAAGELLDLAQRGLRARFAPSLRPVINATGVLLHTNLGRSPLSEAARAALERISAGYSTLELDVESGERGRRQDHIREAAKSLFGCEDAIAVNNNASAVFLALAALARGKRVLVSRGQLVAIGGSFKIPEILEASGARLAEVGTTNRTSISDYSAAMAPDVALLLTVHPSNYEIRGYASTPEPSQIARLARDAGVPWMHDQGTGCVQPLEEFGVAGEQTVGSVLAQGADVVTFSADKLFGGPQAGFLVGRADLIARAASHPVARVVRPDKLTFAALETTLTAWKTEHWRELPLYRRAGAPLSSLEERGARIQEAVSGDGNLSLQVVASWALFGGGTSPEKRFPSRALRLSHSRIAVEDLARRFRRCEVPILGRIEDGDLWLDLRSIDPQEDRFLAEAIRSAAQEDADLP